MLGVYATKPGVLLTDLGPDADLTGRVRVGVVGVIPTKVTSDNGPIRRGDLLVASGIAGHAMKAGAQVPASAAPPRCVIRALRRAAGAAARQRTPGTASPCPPTGVVTV